MRSISPTIIVCILLFSSCGPNADEAFKLWMSGQHDKAFPMLQKLAKRGNAKAQFVVSRCYNFGDHVKKDTAQANYWLRKSAEGGYPEAQLEMSFVSIGVGGEKESYKWMRKCADQLYPGCLQGLAARYEVGGGGVEKNIDSAMAIMKRLALLNSVEAIEIYGNPIANARFKIGTDYCEGNGVDKDLVTGYAWYIIYNECKRHIWPDKQKDNLQKIYLIEDQLSYTEKNAALKTAEDFLGAPITHYDEMHVVK